MKSKNSIFIIVLALALASCLRNEIVFDTDNLDYRPINIVAPALDVHVPLYKSMAKHMDFEELFINGEGVVCIAYTHSEKIGWDDDELGIKDINTPLNWGYDVPYSALPSVSGTISISLPVTTSKTGTYITEAELESCNLNVSFSVPNNLTGNVTITIPQLKDQAGATFTKTYNGLLPGINNFPALNLANHKLETPEKTLKIECLITVSSSGGFVSDKLEVAISINNVNVNYMKGYFGQLEYIPYEADKEIAFDFFDELLFDGTVGIKDIVFEAKTVNSMGAPFNIDAKKISFINEDGTKTDLVQPFIEEVLAATLVNGGNHTVKAATSLYAKTIPEILFEKGKYPTMAHFDFVGTLNPNGDEGGNNFIVKNVDNLAEAQLKLIVPLHVKVGAYNRTDTMKFDYNDIIDNDEKFNKSIKKCIFEMKVDNGLPFAVTISADVIDRWGNIVEKNIIMNENINAKQKSQSPIIMEFTQTQLENFRTKDAKHIVLRTNSKTANEDYVKVMKDDYIDIKVSVNIESNMPNIF